MEDLCGQKSELGTRVFRTEGLAQVNYRTFFSSGNTSSGRLQLIILHHVVVIYSCLFASTKANLGAESGFTFQKFSADLNSHHEQLLISILAVLVANQESVKRRTIIVGCHHLSRIAVWCLFHCVVFLCIDAFRLGGVCTASCNKCCSFVKYDYFATNQVGTVSVAGFYLIYRLVYDCFPPVVMSFSVFHTH